MVSPINQLFARGVCPRTHAQRTHAPPQGGDARAEIPGRHTWEVVRYQGRARRTLPATDVVRHYPIRNNDGQVYWP